MRSAHLRALGVVGLVLSVLSGCEDVRRFSGEWAGVVSADPNLALGFPSGAPIQARIGDATRNSLVMSVQLAPPDGEWLEVLPVRRAAADVLGEMQLPGDPLRNYLGVLSPSAPTGGSALPPYFAVTSLYADDRVELRLIRGAEETYAVFSLQRARHD